MKEIEKHRSSCVLEKGLEERLAQCSIDDDYASIGVCNIRNETNEYQILIAC